MRIYICPMCNGSLTRCGKKRKGRCTDCRYDYHLDECITAERAIPDTERIDCIDADLEERP